MGILVFWLVACLAVLGSFALGFAFAWLLGFWACVPPGCWLLDVLTFGLLDSWAAGLLGFGLGDFVLIDRDFDFAHDWLSGWW